MFIHELTLTSLQRRYIDIKITEGKRTYLSDKDVNKNILSYKKIIEMKSRGFILTPKTVLGYWLIISYYPD